MEEEEEKEYAIEDAEANADNEEFMLQALNDNATWVLAYASDRLHGKKDIMLKAVEKDGQLLYYASKELRDDKEVVMKAVTNKWLIVKYASKRLRNDKDIAKCVLGQNKEAQIYLTDEVLADSEIQAILHPEDINESK